ncbi:MAG: hypothetical protein OHK0029_43130 [Armatimonadaceae bacterium]
MSQESDIPALLVRFLYLHHRHVLTTAERHAFICFEFDRRVATARHPLIRQCLDASAEKFRTPAALAMMESGEAAFQADVYQRISREHPHLLEMLPQPEPRHSQNHTQNQTNTRRPASFAIQSAVREFAATARNTERTARHPVPGK